MTVYAIVKEPWKSEEGYLARFRSEVFANKAKAVSALKDIARKIVREQIGDANGAELEFEKDEVRIAWGHAAGNGESSETTCLRVERLQVPKGRIEFEDGKASVEDWEYVLTKDLRFRKWDYRDWARNFDIAVVSPSNETDSYSIDELRKYCDWWRFVGVAQEQLDMPKLVASCPWFMDRPECSQLRICPGNWALLLSFHPEFSARCESWDAFEGCNWATLLKRQPQFARMCSWDKLDGENWVELLGEQPRFAKHCDWGKIDGGGWVSLLKKYPRFAKHCNWELLRGRDWCELLVELPKFKTHLIRERLKDGTLTKCGWMVGFLEKFPEYISDCDLNELGEDWARFLMTYPQYAKQCDFSGFCADDWGKLLPVHPEFIDKVNWSITWQKKYYCGCVLIELIDKLPEILSYCKWSELRGDVLVEVLKHFPGAADKCDWERLAEADWYNLLQTHPSTEIDAPAGEEKAIEGR